MAHYIGIAKQINEIKYFAFFKKKMFYCDVKIVATVVLTKGLDKEENPHPEPIYTAI